MTMIGGQRSAGAGSVPASVMVEIARDPDRFEARVNAYTKARDEANEAQQAAREAQRELAADRQRFLDERQAIEQDHAEAERKIGEWRNKLAEHERALNQQEQQIAEMRAVLKRDQEALARDRERFEVRARETNQRFDQATASLQQREDLLQQQGRKADALLADVTARRDRLHEVERALKTYFTGEE